MTSNRIKGRIATQTHRYRCEVGGKQNAFAKPCCSMMGPHHAVRFKVWTLTSTCKVTTPMGSHGSSIIPRRCFQLTNHITLEHCIAARARPQPHRGLHIPMTKPSKPQQSKKLCKSQRRGHSWLEPRYHASPAEDAGHKSTCPGRSLSNAKNRSRGAGAQPVLQCRTGGEGRGSSLPLRLRLRPVSAMSQHFGHVRRTGLHRALFAHSAC